MCMCVEEAGEGQEKGGGSGENQVSERHGAH